MKEKKKWNTCTLRAGLESKGDGNGATIIESKKMGFVMKSGT